MGAAKTKELCNRCNDRNDDQVCGRAHSCVECRSTEYGKHDCPALGRVGKDKCRKPRGQIEGAFEQRELPAWPLGSEDNLDPTYRLAGTTSIPRLRRNLHFPVATSPRTPAVNDTLTRAPLPLPPSSLLSNPVLSAALAARPDLFSVSTPIAVARLRGLLSAHPNRPLVDSIFVGLTEGFWPGHHGDFSGISRLSGPALRLEDVDIDFLADYAATDFEKGSTPRAFASLSSTP